MASNDSGTKKLVLLGGLVVVAAGILGYFAIGFPPSDEDAAGTIGAVKKFRAGQIDDADVILTGDVEAPADAIPYQALIADAATLEAMSGDLQAYAALGAKDLVGAKSIARLQAMSETLEAKKMSLGASTIDAVRGQLRAVSQLLGANSNVIEAKTLAGLKAELGAVSQMLEAKKFDLGAKQFQLGAKDLAEVHDRLGAMSAQLGKAADLALGAKDFAIQDRLGAMTADLGARNAITVDRLGAMSADLNASVRQLGAKELSLGARKLAASVDSLGAATLAARKLEATRDELGAAIKTLGAGSQLEARSLERMRGSLGAVSNELGAAARDMQQRSLGHMKFSLDASSKHLRELGAVSAALGAMTKALGNADDVAPGDAANANQGGRGGVADFGPKFGEFKGRLGAFNDSLEAKRLQASADFLGSMKFQLNAASKLLGASDQLGKSAVNDLSGHLGNVKMSLEASSQLAHSSQLGSMKQLGAATRQLEAKAQGLGAKIQAN